MRRRSWLAVLLVALIVLALVLLTPVLNRRLAMNKYQEECKGHTTTGTYTVTTFSTTEVSGVNSTVTSIVTTTGVQICTIS